MLNILITRYGGFGDLILLEPTIEAIYYHYLKEEPNIRITFRTYWEYQDLLKFHPLVSEIILDDNKYTLGDNYGQIFTDTRELDNKYDYVYDFQGVIERSRGLHSVDAWAWQGEALLRQDPQFYIDPNVKVEEHPEVLFCYNGRANGNIGVDLLDNLGYKGEYFLMPKCKSIHHLARLIQQSKLVISIGSAPAHIANALNIPLITIYKSDIAPQRVYPGRQWVTYDTLEYLPKMIEDHLNHKPTSELVVEQQWKIQLKTQDQEMQPGEFLTLIVPRLVLTPTKVTNYLIHNTNLEVYKYTARPDSSKNCHIWVRKRK